MAIQFFKYIYQQFSSDRHDVAYLFQQSSVWLHTTALRQKVERYARSMSTLEAGILAVV